MKYDDSSSSSEILIKKKNNLKKGLYSSNRNKDKNFYLSSSSDDDSSEDFIKTKQNQNNKKTNYRINNKFLSSSSTSTSTSDDYLTTRRKIAKKYHIRSFDSDSDSDSDSEIMVNFNKNSKNNNMRSFDSESSEFDSDYDSLSKGNIFLKTNNRKKYEISSTAYSNFDDDSTTSSTVEHVNINKQINMKYNQPYYLNKDKITNNRNYVNHNLKFKADNSDSFFSTSTESTTSDVKPQSPDKIMKARLKSRIKTQLRKQLKEQIKAQVKQQMKMQNNNQNKQKFVDFSDDSFSSSTSEFGNEMNDMQFSNENLSSSSTSSQSEILLIDNPNNTKENYNKNIPRGKTNTKPKTEFINIKAPEFNKGQTQYRSEKTPSNQRQIMQPIQQKLNNMFPQNSQQQQQQQTIDNQKKEMPTQFKQIQAKPIKKNKENEISSTSNIMLSSSFDDDKDNDSKNSKSASIKILKNKQKDFIPASILPAELLSASSSISLSQIAPEHTSYHTLAKRRANNSNDENQNSTPPSKQNSHSSNSSSSKPLEILSATSSDIPQQNDEHENKRVSFMMQNISDNFTDEDSDPGPSSPQKVQFLQISSPNTLENENQNEPHHESSEEIIELSSSSSSSVKDRKMPPQVNENNAQLNKHPTKPTDSPNTESPNRRINNNQYSNENDSVNFADESRVEDELSELSTKPNSQKSVQSNEKK